MKSASRANATIHSLVDHHQIPHTGLLSKLAKKILDTWKSLSRIVVKVDFNNTLLDVGFVFVGTTTWTVDRTNRGRVWQREGPWTRLHEKPGPRETQEAEKLVGNPINTSHDPTGKRADDLREKRPSVKNESCG